MAQDVYVMPLWRFKAGNFIPPIEKNLGLKPTVISLSEAPPMGRPPWYLRWLSAIGIIEFDEPAAVDPAAARAWAVREVTALKVRLSELSGQPVDWRDEGDVYYNEQFHASRFLRAFARWHDHRDILPEFLPGPTRQFADDYPVFDLPAPAKRRFPTLADHSLHTGYLVPTIFEGVYKVEPFKAFGHWEMHHDVASSRAVLRETADLLTFVAEVKAAGGSGVHVKLVQAVQDWAAVLRKICQLSVEHGVPVIFHG